MTQAVAELEGARIYYEVAGHLVHFEKPEAFNELVLSEIEGLRELG